MPHKTFTQQGYTFALKIEQDDDATPPWQREDGHGVVLDESDPPKRGARPLGRWRYDQHASLSHAASENWGLNHEAREALATRLGRPLTRRDVLEETVRLDYERLLGWVNDDWTYVCLSVHLLTVSGEIVPGKVEYLGGIESDSDDYIAKEAAILAQAIVAPLRNASTIEIRLK